MGAIQDVLCGIKYDSIEIQGYNSLFTAVQVSLAQQNYNVTEGGAVNITLVTNTSNYMFDFTVTLQHIDGSATGESRKCSK